MLRLIKEIIMRFEYKFVEFITMGGMTRVGRIDDVPLKESEAQRPKRTEYCAKLGAEGWEMVSMSTTGAGDQFKSLAAFKRALP